MTSESLRKNPTPSLKRTRTTRGRRERVRPHSKAALVTLFLILVLETNPGGASIARGNRRERAEDEDIVPGGLSNHHRQMVLLQHHHHHRLHANEVVPPTTLMLEPPPPHSRHPVGVGPQPPPRISQGAHGGSLADGHLSYFPSPPDSPRLLRLLGEEDEEAVEDEEAERAEAEAAAAEGRAPRWMMLVEPPPPPISLRPLFDEVTNTRWRQAPPQPPPIPPPRHYYQHPRPPQRGSTVSSAAAAAAAAASPQGTSFSSTFSSSPSSFSSSTSFSSSAATFPSSSSTFSASSRLLPPWSKRGTADPRGGGGSTGGHRHPSSPSSPSAAPHSSRSHGGRGDGGAGGGGGGGGNQLLVRQPRANRQYDVPQIECPPAEDGMERFACPTPDRMGRYRCIDDHVLCDGFIDCPNGEDEDRQACMFYKTTKAHLDVLADALLRWARGR